MASLVVSRSDATKEAFRGCPQFDGETLRVDSISYRLLTHETTDFSTHTASLGSNPDREALLLDPAKSPFLNAQFERIVQTLIDLRNEGRELTEIGIVRLVWIQTIELFAGTNPENFDRYLTERLQSPDIPKVRLKDREIGCLTLDEFASKGLGCCRHQALYLAHILHRLTQGPEPFLSGTVQHIRENIPSGGHAWATYVNKEHRMHIDPTFESFYHDMFSPAAKVEIIRRYGRKAFESEVRKTEPWFFQAAGITALTRPDTPLLSDSE